MRKAFELITDWIYEVGIWIAVGIGIVELTIAYIILKGVIW